MRFEKCCALRQSLYNYNNLLNLENSNFPGTGSDLRIIISSFFYHVQVQSIGHTKYSFQNSVQFIFTQANLYYYNVMRKKGLYLQLDRNLIFMHTRTHPPERLFPYLFSYITVTLPSYINDSSNQKERSNKRQ